MWTRICIDCWILRPGAQSDLGNDNIHLRELPQSSFCSVEVLAQETDPLERRRRSNHWICRRSCSCNRCKEQWQEGPSFPGRGWIGICCSFLSRTSRGTPLRMWYCSLSFSRQKTETEMRYLVLYLHAIFCLELVASRGNVGVRRTFRIFSGSSCRPMGVDPATS